MKKTEMQVTGAAGILGALPIFLDMIQGDGTLPENMLLTLLACVTAMVCAYNISRGMAKTEVRNGNGAAPAGAAKPSEFKLSAAVGGLGAMPVLIDMLRGGEMLSERVKMALMVAITLIAMTYTVGRGMAKTEERTAPPAPPAS